MIETFLIFFVLVYNIYFYASLSVLVFKHKRERGSSKAFQVRDVIVSFLRSLIKPYPIEEAIQDMFGYNMIEGPVEGIFLDTSRNTIVCTVKTKHDGDATSDDLLIGVIVEILKKLKKEGFTISIVGNAITIIEENYSVSHAKPNCTPSTLIRRSRADPASVCSLTSSTPAIMNAHSIVGLGSFGSRVYEGLFENKKRCAIKAITDSGPRVEREIDNLRHANFPNKIGYFKSEILDNTTYIYMELAQDDLRSYFMKKSEPLGKDWLELSKWEICRQVVTGVKELHSRGIAHGDLTPENVLVAPPDFEDGRAVIKLGDFSLSCKRDKLTDLDELRTRSDQLNDWFAPEISGRDIFCFEDFLKADVHALGCLFGYILTEGQHDTLEDLINHLQASYFKASRLEKKKVDYDTAMLLRFRDLIFAMTTFEPEERPSIDCVAKHLAFWPEATCADFCIQVSDLLKQAEPKSQTSKKPKGFTHRLSRSKLAARHSGSTTQGISEEDEAASDELIASDAARDIRVFSVAICRGDDWISLLPDKLIKELEERKFYRQYKGDCPVDLIRVVRNLNNHFSDLSRDARATFGETKADLGRLFAQTFPLLLPILYQIMQFYKTWTNELAAFYCADENIQYKEFDPIAMSERISLRHEAPKARGVDEVVIK